MPKIIKIGQCFRKVFKKYKWHSFLKHGVIAEVVRTKLRIEIKY